MHCFLCMSVYRSLSPPFSLLDNQEWTLLKWLLISSLGPEKGGKVPTSSKGVLWCLALGQLIYWVLWL